MAAAQQIRLLLWKDYLIRKRKPITLMGILWATLIMLSLYIVRVNIDNKYYPTCQFAARALPSAGFLPFLQSFICNANNECSEMDKFEEIPSYENARFTQLQRQVTPLMYNESIVDVAASIPDALKLLATMSDIADNPTFLNITRNGLLVKDLFRNPKRVKRYLITEMDMPEDVAEAVMSAELRIDGIFKGGLDRCSVFSIDQILNFSDIEQLKTFVNHLCAVPQQHMQKVMMDLLLELDLGKYITMAGEMYFKLSNDSSIMKIGEMLAGGLRMTSLDSFLPNELTALLGKDVDLNYVNLTMVTKILDIFKPIFGETEAFKSLTDLADVAITGLKMFGKIFAEEKNNNEVSFSNQHGTKSKFKKIKQIISNAYNVIQGVGPNEFISFQKLPKIMNFIIKWLPDGLKHDVLFYSTLMAKLMESAHKVITINMNIEQWFYNASLRNPEAVKILINLPPDVIRKGVDALVDAERIQEMTSRLDDPSQVFCDISLVQKFFLVSTDEANKIKDRLCTDPWKNYINQLIDSFGIKDVKNYISSIASLFIQDIIGVDISSKLYTIEKDFDILKNFTEAISRMDKQKSQFIDWKNVFSVADNSEFMKIFQQRPLLGKHMLITVHGAFAKEVIQENRLLEYKLMPALKDALIVVEAINKQLSLVSKNITDKVKEVYPLVVQTVLETALDEEKTYRELSTPCEDMFCHGAVNATKYVTFPPNIDQENLAKAMCDMSIAIEDGLKKDQIFGKAIDKIKNTKQNIKEEMDYTKMIKELNILYEKLYNDYTYLFEYKTFGMDEIMMKDVIGKFEIAKDYWLNHSNRMTHLMVKIALRFLDVLDHDIFRLSNEAWLKMKFGFNLVAGPIEIMHDFMKLIIGTLKKTDDTSNVPEATATILKKIIPNVPLLIMDAVNLVTKEDIDVSPVIDILNASPAWPCSSISLTNVLPISEDSKSSVQELETLLCFNETFEEQWAYYLAAKNITSVIPKSWNTTTYTTRVFLKFSSAFDLFVEDINYVEDIVGILNSNHDSITIFSALEYAIEILNATNRDTLKTFFSKVDLVLNSINTSSIPHNLPLNDLWKAYFKCIDNEPFESCKGYLRSSWKYTLQFISITINDFSENLFTYFKEANEPNTTVLQILGFTRNTGLYMLYDRLPDFVAVLVNSYWDLDFMGHIRRASQTHFWDCEELVESLEPAPGSVIRKSDILRVQPLVCPSIFYWVSLPQGENILMDVIAKPQYFFFTTNVTNMNSSYENAFTNTNRLTDFLKNISLDKNKIKFDLDTMKHKLEKAVDAVLSYKINAIDPSYVNFKETSQKQVLANIYLARIATIVNKIETNINNVTVANITEEGNKNLTNDINAIKNLFKRRPKEILALHFDVITKMLWNNEELNLVEALKNDCENLKSKNNSKHILIKSEKVKTQICSKKYELFYNDIDVVDDLSRTKKSLYILVDTVENGLEENITDIAKFLNERDQIISIWKKTIRYSDELGIPIFLKYLQSNIQHYSVIASFLSGEDWWSELRKLYDGPIAGDFLDSAERVFDMAEEILLHLDRLHVVKLIRDVEVNSNDTSLCRSNLSLSEYIPEKDLANVVKEFCNTDSLELMKEIPPLVFALQGYSELKISPEIDYPTLYSEIDGIETQLENLKNGLKTPRKPLWITDEKLTHLRKTAMQLLSSESMVKMSFGAIINMVDAGILFLNTSQCTYCSELTSWFKQINLQLFKKQEYDNLLCQMNHMSLEDIYQTLKNDFHWDMAVTELISTRNYTKFELNKSINEFLEQVKLLLLEDINANSSKLSECLAQNVTRNVFGNISLLTQILARTVKLFKAELPHLHEVAGITELPFMKQLYSDVAHNLVVTDIISNYLTSNFSEAIKRVLEDEIYIFKITNADVDLLAIKNRRPVKQYLFLSPGIWENICDAYNCEAIANVIDENINRTLVDIKIPELQSKEFWNFSFISNIMHHVQDVLEHLARVIGVVSKLDIEGVTNGKLAAMLDTMMQLLMNETLESLLYSISGLLKEATPIIRGTQLEHDIEAITTGLSELHNFKNYIVKADIKVYPSQVFSHPEHIESGLSKLGINNTNFWSVAAPRIHTGYINLRPIFDAKQPSYHISSFVCQVENMSQALVPADLDVVTADDVYGAVIEQFCGLSDDQAKQMLPVLIENLNYTFVLDKLKVVLLSKLFLASNVTQDKGDKIFKEFGKMAAILSEVQEQLEGISDTMAAEPLLTKIKNGGSIGDIATSSGFMSDVGNMMCGKPFHSEIGRFYTAIVQVPDLATKPDEAQLAALPTDYCRSFYKEVISVAGGKILWSYAKPLLGGRILYTPASPAVERIINEARSFFNPMIKLVDIIHSFAQSFPAVGKLSDHRNGLLGLQDLLVAPQYEELRKVLIGDIKTPSVDVNELFNSFGDIESTGDMLSKASNLLRCINLDRFKAVPSELELTAQAVNLTRVNEFSAGLVFMNIKDGQTDMPANIEYKIRTDIENSPTTKRLKNYLWIPGPESNFLEDMRYFRGFVQIQDIIDKAIIQASSPRLQKRDAIVRTHEQHKDWAVYTQQIPYPCYTRDSFQTSLYESQSLIVAFVFALLLTVSSVIRFIVADKESGNTMLMSVMGVNLSYHTLSWFAWSLLELAVTSACVVAVLCAGRVLPRTEPTLLYALLLLYDFAVLCFCYMMSKLFTSASFAAVCTGIAYIITFMPFIMILSLEAVLTTFTKIVVGISMSSSLSYILLLFARFEARSEGCGWADVWASPGNADNINIATLASMILFDSILYIILGMLLERFLGTKAETNITNCKATGEKAGVSIVNVSKLYGKKLALDNVSMELQTGQITSLLGHNGAGKTTLIKILTGMLKPSKGHVVVRSADGARCGVGVCPQHDVLFEYMSAREHVALYAQLKSGLPLDKVKDEVESMLSVLELGGASGSAAARLSGGTRRRLCVALAFVARPALVSLDEPTAGVDPAARRDIWSMIMRLRENRTILLTTHHLDEAELLSDQIVIMHKGQIHTSGSPIEIKRSLGTGYRLTVTYPDRRQTILRDSYDNEDYIEEKTKMLVATTRSVIKNASLVDINGSDVDINLPFYDADGVSNNFLNLCETLEKRQSELEFEYYSMECSSLEQVFFNICQQADSPNTSIEFEPSSKSASTSSFRTDRTLAVNDDGPLRGTNWLQFYALIQAKYLHYSRNRWLLFVLIILPSLFVTIAMGFSTIRPPANPEIALKLYPGVYEGSTQFIVPHPSIYSKESDPSFGQQVLNAITLEESSHITRRWTNEDSPACKCENGTQHCVIDVNKYKDLPQMMILPNVNMLNNWLVDSQKIYIERRYGGYTAVIKDNITNLIAWYNNKGHHALPAFVNSLNSAALKVVTNNPAANITVFTHPLKISEEQINKDTLYQHVADAGISVILVMGYSLVSGGAGALVAARGRRERRLHLLCALAPLRYWAAALLWDLAIYTLNIAITAVVLEAFHFPVFVARNNLPAICLLLFLYGYASSALTHCAEKLFNEPSMANMILFCGNTFLGFAGMAILMIFDIISDSDATDHVRWVLHKIFMLSPPFVLGDGLLEIAKNTIKYQVLSSFGMDTYQDPLNSSLVLYHYIALVLVGTFLILINMAVEYNCFDFIFDWFQPKYSPVAVSAAEADVRGECERVRAALEPLRLSTIGNINAGYVHTEEPAVKLRSLSRSRGGPDAAAAVRLTRVFRAPAGPRLAVCDLTLGVPRGQCTALLGENGAGKSTTFAMLTGDLRPTSGDIYLDNKKVTSRELCKGLISYCPQQDAIDPFLTVRETLQFYCKLRGITDTKEVIKRTVDMFELTRYLDVRNSALSGGTKRKLCTAIAFMARTSLVLLDEPTSGMDPGSRVGVWRALVAAGGSGRGVLLTTHALADARRAATRVALMRRARLVALAPLHTCLTRFGGGYVCACRVRRGGAGAAWARVRAARPRARLLVLHHTALHFLLPADTHADDKEPASVRGVFQLAAQLAAAGYIEDFTVNQSSLDQMFLSFSEKQSIVEDEEVAPASADLTAVTAL